MRPPNPRPPCASEVRNAMCDQGPWFAGSSCTQSKFAFGCLLASATISSIGSGYKSSTRTIAVPVSPSFARSATRSW